MSAPSAARPLLVQIDELDLSGVPEARRPAVAAAFQRELVRLLQAEPAHSAQGAPLREAPALVVPLDGPPERVGAALAASVYDALHRAEDP